MHAGNVSKDPRGTRSNFARPGQCHMLYVGKWSESWIACMNQESSSPWNSRNGLLQLYRSSKVMAPYTFVGTIRLVNRVAKVDSYTLPRIDDLFASLAGGKLYSKLDLANAYQQIPLANILMTGATD